ncbi:MAG TPA: hypothetical protein VHK65_08735 [Candidatus Dormibacteraeota bacterium]|nr:hypothetical protein [Candidatus Dormibacteraeota bacterium]
MRAASAKPDRAHGATEGRKEGIAKDSASDDKSSHPKTAHTVRSIWMVRSFLFVQIAIFLILVLIHFGLLIGGYRHQSAGATESLIVAVLALGLWATWTPAPWNQRAATAAQCFGTVGVLVGLLTIGLGIGPRTILDLSLDLVLLLVLIAGLAYPLVAVRIPSQARDGER